MAQTLINYWADSAGRGNAPGTTIGATSVTSAGDFTFYARSLTENNGIPLRHDYVMYDAPDESHAFSIWTTTGNGAPYGMDMMSFVGSYLASEAHLIPGVCVAGSGDLEKREDIEELTPRTLFSLSSSLLHRRPPARSFPAPSLFCGN